MKLKVNTKSVRMEKNVPADTLKTAKIIATRNELDTHKKKLKHSQYLNIALIAMVIILGGILWQIS